MLIKFTPWYGIDATCYHCGATFGDDGCQTLGRSKVEHVRKTWLVLSEVGVVEPCKA